MTLSPGTLNMADSITFSVYCTESSGKVFNYSKVELESTHRFWFGPSIQKRSILRATLGTLLVVIGMGLVLAASAWTSITAPLTTTGGIVILFGSVLFIHTWFDWQSRIAIDSRGIQGRIGLRSISILWSQVDRWAIHQQGGTPKAGLVVWFKSGQVPFVIGAEYIDSSDRRLLGRVFRAFMPDGEVDARAIHEMMQANKSNHLTPVKWA